MLDLCNGLVGKVAQHFKAEHVWFDVEGDSTKKPVAELGHLVARRCNHDSQHTIYAAYVVSFTYLVYTQHWKM